MAGLLGAAELIEFSVLYNRRFPTPFRAVCVSSHVETTGDSGRRGIRDTQAMSTENGRGESGD